jgi:hypothetical protein
MKKSGLVVVPTDVVIDVVIVVDVVAATQNGSLGKWLAK